MSYQRKPLLSKKYRYYFHKILPESIHSRYIGRHEKISLNIWRLIAAKVPAEFSILDIGAFHGEFAVIARKVNKFSKIYAFEPNPDSLKLLNPICQENQIEVIENALFNENKKVYFKCKSRLSSITGDDFDNDTIEIYTITLDSWIEENHRQPYLMKIDVEDAVAAVLLGSQTTLYKYRPVMICEILRDDVGLAVTKLIPKNYIYYLINENSGLEAKQDIKRYDWRYKNWLFMPEEKNYLI